MNLSGNAAHLLAKMGLHDLLQTGYVHLYDNRLAHKLNQYHDTAFTISHLVDPVDADERSIAQPNLVTCSEQALGIRLHNGLC